MLIVRGWPSIGGSHGPAILGQQRPARTRCDDGLYGDYEALGEDVPGVRVGIVRNARLFVDGASNPISAQFPDYRESVAAHFPLDTPPDFRDAKTRPGNQHRLFERPAGANHQSL